TLLAFVVVAAVARSLGGGTALEEHRGLLRSRPLLALPLALALLTLAGLPPGIAGVVAKIVALRPVLGGGSEWLWLALVAAVNIALGIAVYLRWLAVVVAAPAAQQGEGEAPEGGDPAREGDDPPREGDEPPREARHTPLPV